jgi:hypothetical protein
MASQSLLLGAFGRTRCASAESLDFQTRLGRPPVGDPGDPGGTAPGVLVLTRAADREVDELSLRLAVRGVPMLRLDSDRSAGLELTWDVLDGVVETPDVCFAPRTVWLRHFSGASVPSQGTNGVDDYVREQWVAWSRMVLAGARSLVVNGSVNGTAQLGATDRVAQLAAARQVGLRVPATVVTSRPGSAADRIPGHGDLVVKSLGDPFVEPVPGCLRTVFPRRLSRAELSAVRAVEPAPVMVQEFVPSSRRLRVYAVGGELIGFELGARLDAGFGGVRHGSVTPVPVPGELDAQLGLLARRWGMDVAAFDLLDTAAGPVFLHVTAACEWLRLERAARVATVTDAVAGLLEKNFHRAA